MRHIGLIGVSALAIVMCHSAPAAAASQTTPGETPPLAPATQAPRTTVYDPGFFAKYAPRSALDIVQRIPGFTLDLGNTSLRGFAGAAGNVVINGQRPSTKSEALDAFLGRIPANRVKRVEVGPGDLYGAEYSSKTQVVNLLLAEGGGMSGNLVARATRYFTGDIIPTASGSVVLSRGPSTFNVSADIGRSDYFEKGFDELRDFATDDLIERRLKFNTIRPHDPFVSGSWSLEHSDSQSAHLNARYQPSHFKLFQRNHVIPVDGPERNDVQGQNYHTPVFELGGDVTRPLAGGAIKLVGLATRRKRDNRDFYNFRDITGSQILGGFEQLQDARLNESIARLTWTRPKLFGFSFETGGEVAWNTLDDHLELYSLLLGGGRKRIDLPIDDAKVTELRGELYVNAGRPLTKQLRVDLGLNYEISRLKVRGDATADRSLRFLKPSITLDWQPGGGWHTQAILRRTVAQLDFFDFVSAAEISVGRVNGGNANLQPQRAWEGRLLFEHPLFTNGKARLELGYNLISMLQDRILVFDSDGNAFDAPGNLGTGRQMYADLTLDAPLDKFWKGLRVRLHGNVQSTRVHDPISGELRDFSGFFPRWTWDIDIRRDAGKFAYGLGLFDNRRITFFRTDEFDTNQNSGFPFTNAFVEYRPTPKQTVTLNLEDISNTPGTRDRILFDPNRTSPEPALHEHRFRNSHVRIGLTFKQSFGSSAAAK